MTTTYEALVKWIAQGGGYVHPELELRGTGSDRGIFAKSLIRCGESLIRLSVRVTFHSCW